MPVRLSPLEAPRRRLLEDADFCDSGGAADRMRLTSRLVQGYDGSGHHYRRWFWVETTSHTVKLTR